MCGTRQTRATLQGHFPECRKTPTCPSEADVQYPWRGKSCLSKQASRAVTSVLSHTSHGVWSLVADLRKDSALGQQPARARVMALAPRLQQRDTIARTCMGNKKEIWHEREKQNAGEFRHSKHEASGTHVKLTGEFRQASLMRAQTRKIRMYAAGTVTANYVCFSLAAWLLYTFRRALCAWLKREHYCATRGTL